MKAITAIDMLEATAYALVGERCRQSYLHDMRGGLQTLRGAVELLARAADKPGENPGLADKASGLARRAVATHEKSVIELVGHLTPYQEMAGSVNLGELVQELLQFMRGDLMARSVAFRLEAARDAAVLAQAHKCRLLILGLICTLTDGLAAGSSVAVVVARAGPDALVEFRTVLPSRFVPSLADLWRGAEAALPAFDLLLVLTRQWVEASGGRLELMTQADLPDALQIFYPLAPA